MSTMAEQVALRSILPRFPKVAHGFPAGARP
jgi:hypothetical protein